MNRILDRLGAPPQGYGGIYEDNTPATNRQKANRVAGIGERYIQNIRKSKNGKDGYWRFEEPWFHEQASRRTYMGLNGG